MVYFLHFCILPSNVIVTTGMSPPHQSVPVQRSAIGLPRFVVKFGRELWSPEHLEFLLHGVTVNTCISSYAYQRQRNTSRAPHPVVNAF